MNKIAIVCDSTVSFTKEEKEKYGVYIVPNVIVHNDEVFLDQVTITNAEIYNLLENNETITTSQPSIGSIIEVLEDVKKQGYDYIIVMCASSSLSGGFNAFSQAVKQAKLDNCTVIDSRSLAGPVQQAVRSIRKMNENSASIEEILKYLEMFFNHQISYLYPKTLDQIVASGRLSRTGGKIASLLKVKVVLYFQPKSTSIERLGIARTDKKVFEMIINHLKANNVNPKEYDLYFLEGNAMDQVEKAKDYIFKELGEFKYRVVNLPAALSVHAGVGAIVVQSCLKVVK